MNETLSQALKYLELGFSIIPIGDITLSPEGKKNIVYPIAWTKYQTTPPTKEEVTEWFTTRGFKNIGIITGNVSKLFVLDCDSYKPEFNKELFKGFGVPVTITQQTARGGFQYFFRYTGNARNATGIIADNSGMDIRANGGMVVAPPTTTSYGEYSWIVSPDDSDLAPLPPKMEELFAQQKAERTDWKEFFSVSKGEGVRNMSSAQVAGKLLSEMSPDIWNTLGIMAFKTWNKEFNNPPLANKELMVTWVSIQKTHIRNNDIQPPTGDGEVKVSDELEDIVRVFKKNKTEGTFMLAKHIVNKYNIITIGEKDREMFVYQDGYYHAGAENLIIYPEIQKILGCLVNKNAKTETYHKIADDTSHPRSIFTQTPERYIPLKNGVYDFETKQLLPHSPDYKFKYQFPIIYDPEATCPKTDAFLNQILNPTQRLIVEEWIGYYFWRNYMFKKAMVFVGEGDTGKTTLLEVIVHLIGRENISAISLQKMTSDKFSAAHMYEKHGNIVDELSAKDISDTDAFKMATGNGSVTGEYKFGNQFSFQNFAKLTYACNRIPDMADNNDSAYFNRWVPIRFENTITKKIPNFIKTLQTEEERSGLFNLAMVSLERLLNQGEFSYGCDAEQTKLEMMRSGSSIAMFASDMLERKDGAELTKEDMYDAYVDYCKEKKISTQTKDALGKRLSNYATFVADGTMDGLNARGKVDRVRCWRNAKIKGKEEKIDKAEDEFNNFNN